MSAGRAVDATFRVVVDIELSPDNSAGLERLWLDIADEVAEQDGCLGQWLMRHASKPATFVIMSDWVDAEAFHRFEQGPVHARHRELIAPLRTGGTFNTLQVLHHRMTGVTA